MSTEPPALFGPTGNECPPLDHGTVRAHLDAMSMTYQKFLRLMRGPLQTGPLP
jgi:hypothetical protein